MADLTLNNFKRGNKFISEQNITTTELQNQTKFLLEIVVRVNLGSKIKNGADNKLYFIVEDDINLRQFRQEILKCLDDNGYEHTASESMVVKFRQQRPKYVYKDEDLEHTFSNGMNMRISTTSEALSNMESDEDLTTAIDKRCFYVYILPETPVISTQSAIPVNNSTNGSQSESTHNGKRQANQSASVGVLKKKKKTPVKQEMTIDNLQFLLLDIVLSNTKLKPTDTKKVAKEVQKLKVVVGKVVKKGSDGVIEGDIDKLAAFTIDTNKRNTLKLSKLRALSLLYLDQLEKHLQVETLSIGINSTIYLRKNIRVRKVVKAIKNYAELNRIIHGGDLPTETNDNGVLTAIIVISFGMMKSDDKCAVTTEYVTQQVKRSESIRNIIPTSQQAQYYRDGFESDSQDSENDDTVFLPRHQT